MKYSTYQGPCIGVANKTDLEYNESILLKTDYPYF